MAITTQEEALQLVVEKYGDIGKTDIQRIESGPLIFFTVTPIPESGNPDDSDITYQVEQDGRIYRHSKSESNDRVRPTDKEERQLQVEKDARILEVIERKTSLQSTNAQIDQLKDEPDYWLVSEVTLEGEDIVGGMAYVVNKYEDVAQVSSSKSPRERLQEAKDYFEQQGLAVEHTPQEMTADEALRIVTKYHSEFPAQVVQIDGEPDYWLVTPQLENGEPLVGGNAYVVTKNALIFETSASMPPHARIQAAKDYFNKLRSVAENIAASPEEALATLNGHFTSQGSDDSSSTLEAWNITPYEDAYIFSPKGARSNSLYIVKGSTVSSFSPATTSVDEAYQQLGG